MRIVGMGAILLLTGITPLSALAQDANQGRNLAATCANCHGTDGRSAGGIEALAGVPKDQIVQKMKDFKSGARPGTIMPQLAKGYSDPQIDLLAEYFSKQKAGQRQP